MIKHLEIAGYKSIKNMELELKPINVLIGANGAGKSNFISFFKLLNALSNGNLQAFVLEEGKADKLLYFGRKHTELILGKLFFSKHSDHNNAYIFKIKPTKEGLMYISEEKSGYNTSLERENENYLTRYNLEETSIACSSNYRDQYLNSYLSSIRIFHFHDTSATAKLRQASDIKDNRYLKSDGRNLAAFLYHLKQNYPKNYRRILKTIQSVAPFIHDLILAPNRIHNNGYKEIELRWIEKNDLESDFSAYQFSDGTLRFIALTVTLLQPEPPAIIIIDEPELGLHPFAINKLAGMIKTAASKIQVILSTQSINLVDCFEPQDVVVVDRNMDSQQSVFRRLAEEELTDWLEEHSLGDLWQRDILNAAQPFIR
ncbi:MAG: AAA family ATPase [Bacteroidota bacterium]